MSIISSLAKFEKSGTPIALCTIIKATGATPRHAGSKMLVSAEGRVEGSIGGGEVETLAITKAIRALDDNSSHILRYTYPGISSGNSTEAVGEIEVFIDPILPKVTIVVVGGGHVGMQVVFLSKWLGYQVILSDDRPDFCDPVLRPGADRYFCCLLSELPDHFFVTKQTCFVLTTRNAEVDIEGLPNIINAKPGYIGVIGSQRRWQSTQETLINKGISKSEIENIHSPIGLMLNAETPEEIAISILGEILPIANPKTVTK